MATRLLMLIGLLTAALLWTAPQHALAQEDTPPQEPAAQAAGAEADGASQAEASQQDVEDELSAFDPEIQAVARELDIAAEDLEDDYYGLTAGQIRSKYYRDKRKVKRWKNLPEPETLVEVDPMKRLLGLLEQKGVLNYEEVADFAEWYNAKKIERDEQLQRAILIEQVDDPEELEFVKLGRKNIPLEEPKHLFSSNWAQRIRFGGDIRLRHESQFRDSGNLVARDPEDPTGVVINSEDRHRMRYRVRLGLKAKVNEQVEAGLRIATGNENDPVSTNDTFGDFSTGDSIVLDRAYVVWNPYNMVGPMPLKLWGGRIKNPYMSTDLLWDSDLGFEGIAIQYKPKVHRLLKLFLNAGGYSVQEFQLSQDDRWLVGGQFGVEVKFRQAFKTKLAVAYYDYFNIQGAPDDAFDDLDDAVLALPINQRGNSLVEQRPDLVNADASPYFSLLSDYNLLNVTGQFEVTLFDPIFVTIVADWVRNMAYDLDQIAEQFNTTKAELESFGIKGGRDTGYQVGIKVGHKVIQTFGDWRFSLFYKYLEADAVLAAFTDSDFNGGGTNSRGWILKGDVAVMDNVWVTSKWITANEIDGTPLAVDTLQMDLNVRY